MDLNTVRTFVKVVEFGSFTKAAEALQQPKSRVSRAVSSLEKSLKTQLMYRTTRQLHLTSAGTQFYHACRDLVLGFETATDSLMSTAKDLQGTIRITAPVDVGALAVNPLLRDFSNLHPKVVFDLYYTDQVIDLVKEGIDIAIRAAPLKDSRMKAKRGGDVMFTLVAAPQLLDKIRIPKHPKDLEQLPCLHFGNLSQKKIWRLYQNKLAVDVKIDPIITINHVESICEMAVAKKGIAFLPDFATKSFVESGHLMHLLKDWRGQSTHVHIVMPGHKESSPRVRALVDYLVPRLQSVLS